MSTERDEQIDRLNDVAYGRSPGYQPVHEAIPKGPADVAADDMEALKRFQDQEEYNTHNTCNTPQLGEGGGDPVADLLGKLRSAAALNHIEFPPVQYIVDRIMTEGFGLLVGAPKAGKSWLALSIVLAVRCGGTVLGSVPVDQRPVLYFALEDGDRRLQTRSRVLMVGQEIPDYTYQTKTTWNEALTVIGAWLDVNPSGLVVVDTLAKIRPAVLARETDYDRDTRVGTALKDIADSHLGSAILLIHHTRKTSMRDTDWMDSTLGSQGINGTADYTIGLFRERGKPNAVLKVTGRDIPDGEYAVMFNGGVWTLDGDDFDAAEDKAQAEAQLENLSDTTASVVNAVNKATDPVQAGEIAKALGMNEANVRVILSRAVKDGRIDKVSRGLYAKLPVEQGKLEHPDSPGESVTSVTSVTSGAPGFTPQPEKVTGRNESGGFFYPGPPQMNDSTTTQPDLLSLGDADE